MQARDPDMPNALRSAVNLASPRLGAQVFFATDDFFAAKERLIQDADPVFHPGRFDENGKWMDGWESRRRRNAGHDWCLIHLGVKGQIQGVEIDTRHFTGNYPRAAALEGCLSDDPPGEGATWREILPAAPLGPDKRHFYEMAPTDPVNWLRFHIYPDGGVARLRLYGAPYRAWRHADPNAVHELSHIKNGGRIIGYSDAHYGDVWALLSDGRGVNMGDGWETRRRREPGNDWIIIQLGHPGAPSRIEIDTAHFKGNYPYRASVEAALAHDGTDESVLTQSIYWDALLPPQPLDADKVHGFAAEALNDLGPVSHVRLSIYPDGGVSRFRVFGRIDAEFGPARSKAGAA